MYIEDFSKKYKLSQRDAEIVEKLYKGKSQSEKTWYDTLKDKVVLRSEYVEPKRETKKEEVIKKLKRKKLQNKTDKQ